MPATSKTRSRGASPTGRTRNGNRAKNNRSRMDAIALLKKDHQTVRQLLKKLVTNAENGRSEASTLLRQIENELRIHTQIEEEIFYPAFRDAVTGEKDEHIYYEALEEHHVVDLVLAEFKSTTRNYDEFPAKAKVLKDLVEHHAEEEESEMFPAAHRALGAAELRELGQRLKERKEELVGGMTGRIQKMFQPVRNNKRRAA